MLFKSDLTLVNLLAIFSHLPCAQKLLSVVFALWFFQGPKRGWCWPSCTSPYCSFFFFFFNFLRTNWVFACIKDGTARWHFMRQISLHTQIEAICSHWSGFLRRDCTQSSATTGYSTPWNLCFITKTWESVSMKTVPYHLIYTGAQLWDVLSQGWLLIHLLIFPQ